MKCLKCKKTFKDTLDKCPFCHTKVSNSSNDDFKEDIELIEKMEKELSKTIELKTTKRKLRDNREVSLDETVAINVLNDNNFTLLDEINKQIDNINEEAQEELSKYDNYIDVEEELASVESFKKRRKVLVITGIASLTLITFMIILFIISGNIRPNNNVGTIDYNQSLKESLNTYYETSEIDDLIYLMEDIKDDEAKLKDLQDTVKNTCYSWVLRYKEEDAKSTEEFETITFKYKELIDGIFRYALIKTDEQYVRALNEVDYDEIMLQFDQIYTDSLVFYEALDFYNEKDYNKAYYMFGKIEDNNTYYDKSVTYLNKIHENILELLNKDITKIEKDIDTLSDEDKLNVYILIEETILEYNNVYNVNLSDNLEYQEILSKYTSKVSQYTDIVYNN
ncbi:MAG: hypothetical protein IKM55_03865 [Bacilli bacterium]|nr:hypothetical protein [Bacilli bacterium]